MSYNPYTEPCTALRDKVDGINLERRTRGDKLDQHDQFDMDSTHSAVCEMQREIERLEVESSTLSCTREHREKRHAEIKSESAMSLNPMKWLDKGRLAAARQLEEVAKSVEEIKHRQKTVGQRLVDVKKGFSHSKALLAYHRTFDRLKVLSELQFMDEQRLQLAAELAQVVPLRDRVDSELREPLNQREKLLSHRDTYRRNLASAEAFERNLSSAGDGRERRQIHVECEAKFGTGRPAAVIGDMRRKLEVIERDLYKVERRLKLIRERAARRIKRIVIDGSNLCFERGDQFIGLSALIPLVRKLADSYAVLVVCDASMRGRLRMRDREIRAALDPRVKLHVVAHGQKADVPLLRVASDVQDYVLSNDRFVEYKDMAPVHEGRILRHEILDGRILIEDLLIDEPLEGPAVAA